MVEAPPTPPKNSAQRPNWWLQRRISVLLNPVRSVRMCTRLQAPQEPRPAPPWRTNFARSITRQADRARLWLRNLGRDDRVVSDWGCEARYPFLDEGVVATVAALPLPLLCDLRQVAGRGDKQVLRRLARRVGLTRCASLQKRAIQFGTRIANKNVSGEALLGAGVRLEDIVHPP